MKFVYLLWNGKAERIVKMFEKAGVNVKDVRGIWQSLVSQVGLLVQSYLGNKSLQHSSI